VREFITHRANGLLTPCLDPARLADTVLMLLEDRELEWRLRIGARQYAERHLAMAEHLSQYQATIRRLTRGGDSNLEAVRVA